jgi:succinyl-diaminopimelate desuccinylase
LTVATEGGAATLSADQRGWIDRARAELDQMDLGALVRDMTAIPSPTGDEAALAAFLARHLGAAGIEARVQPVGGRQGQANAIGHLAGSGDGPTLLLYSAIDTPFGANPAEDAPWLGEGPRADWALPPTEQDGKVIGLGADNPKGFAAAVVAAAEAVARAGVPLRGDVWIALASGSMPISGGLGSGISAILDEVGPPDFAILAKPGYAVAHEEVGFAWFRITVRGALNYTGIRHKGPYRNPIVGAAAVVTELEAWFADYAAANTSGLVAPQGSINAISAGSADRLAFVPATAQIDLDLRLGPRTSADDAEAQLRDALDRIRAAHPDMELELERVLALPGTATEPASWIVRSLVAAWEEREGREHAPLKNGSGASDATIIRARGIPAARIGPPPPATPNPYPGFSMGQADIASLRALAELLVRAIVDTGSRSRAEVGL